MASPSAEFTLSEAEGLRVHSASRVRVFAELLRADGPSNRRGVTLGNPMPILRFDAGIEIALAFSGI
ncbi:MAG: hypothetical protein ACRD2G_19515 [Terriglobia bacterium]